MNIRLFLLASVLSLQASALSSFNDELLLTPGKIEAAEKQNLSLSNSTLVSEDEMIARQIERAEMQMLKQKISDRIQSLEVAQEQFADVEDSGGMITKIGQYIEIIQQKLDAAINDYSSLQELDLESEQLINEAQ